MVLGTLLLGKDGNFIVLPFWLFLGVACCVQADLLALATACV